MSFRDKLTSLRSNTKKNLESIHQSFLNKSKEITKFRIVRSRFNLKSILLNNLVTLESSLWREDKDQTQEIHLKEMEPEAVVKTYLMKLTNSNMDRILISPIHLCLKMSVEED